VWEDIQEGGIEELIFPQIEDGALYSIRVTNQCVDWEGESSYDLEVYKIEEEEK